MTGPTIEALFSGRTVNRLCRSSRLAKRHRGGNTQHRSGGSDDRSSDHGNFLAALLQDPDKSVFRILGGGVVTGPQEPSTAKEPWRDLMLTGEKWS